jgi:alkanesulfonate monooxygenase SsuD/methylene tetrahydromethanopterin reductase-like flavin-dependent oxidoreductase (luciferase family)
LPSFQRDPDVVIEMARAAERSGIDAVFVFYHLFDGRRPGRHRPALDGLALLGALAVETTRIGLGTLVARASLRPPATLAVALDTAARIAGPDRLIAGVGAGDRESRIENETFGLEFGTLDSRLARLHETVLGVRDRSFPVWVGGTHPRVRALAAECADGWNRWGGSADRFAEDAREVRAAARRSPFTISWGGLVALGEDDDDADAKAKRLGAGPHVLVGGPRRMAEALGRYGDGGAEWLILGPLDPAEPTNAAILVEAVAPLL